VPTRAWYCRGRNFELTRTGPPSLQEPWRSRRTLSCRRARAHVRAVRRNGARRTRVRAGAHRQHSPIKTYQLVQLATHFYSLETHDRGHQSVSDRWRPARRAASNSASWRSTGSPRTNCLSDSSASLDEGRAVDHYHSPQLCTVIFLFAETLLARSFQR
jgi:hypothetical protein